MPTMDAYVRVSKTGGREGESYRSPALQRDAIRRTAKREGVTLGKEVTDEDVSGGKAHTDRGIEELIQRAERGATEGVIVDAIDRFGRTMLDGCLALQRLIDAGARVVSAEGDDSSRPDGRKNIQLRLLIAEDYLNRVRANWKRATESAAASGIHCARAPIGFVRGDDRRLRADDAKIVAAVVEAFTLRAQGASFPVATRPIEAALGRRLSRNTFARMVANRAYLGEIKRGDMVVKGAHEALISPELFAAAKQGKAVYRPRERSAAERVMLSGLVACGSCGGRMKVQVDGRSGRASYVCQPHRVGNPCPNPAAALAEAVDGLVVAELGRDWDSVIGGSGSEEADYLRAKDAVERADAELEVWMEDEEMQPADRKRMILKSEARVEAAQAALYALPDPGLADAPIVWLDGKPQSYGLWGEDIDSDRRVLRSCVKAVTVAKADPARRRWQPIEERIAVAWRG